MKTQIKSAMIMVLSILIFGLSACKKDKKTENPEPQPVEVKSITITDLRALSTGASIKIPDGRKVKGIIISDVTAKNIDSKMVVLQEATDKPAILVTFDAAQTFAMGDEVEVVISNQTLAQVNGEIIVQNVPAANAKKTGTGTIAPKETTIADINTNKTTWNGTLVSINATELFSADGKYKGALNIKDASGTLISTIATGATFENTALPLSVTKVKGIVRINGTVTRIDIRNTSDISSGDITRVDELIGLEEKIGYQSIGAFKYTPLFTDVSFLDPQKQYYYLHLTQTTTQISANTSYTNGALVTASKSIEATAKFVTVTFAGSTVKGVVNNTDVGLTAINFPQTDFPAFDPALHNIKIAIYAQGKLLIESPAYTETGKFFTLKVKLPTKDELIAMGLNSIIATRWVADPKFTIYNTSAKRTTSTQGDNALVVISKVEVSY